MSLKEQNTWGIRAEYSHANSSTVQIFIKEQLLQLLLQQKKYKAALQISEKTLEELTTLLSDHRQYSALQTKGMMQLRLNQLREENLYQNKLLEDDKKYVEEKRANLLPKIRFLQKAQISLLASKQLLEENKITLSEDRNVLQKSENDILSHRWNLITQLKIIFPISQSTDGKSFSINGFRLPNSDFTGCDEEQIATALGFICHVVYMVAKYLEVPLRYPMIPMCSRSIIRDDISQQSSPKFPLYSRGVDRTRFEYAVFLLNKNVEQLVNSYNLDVITLRHTLPNLQILLSNQDVQNPNFVNQNHNNL